MCAGRKYLAAESGGSRDHDRAGRQNRDSADDLREKARGNKWEVKSFELPTGGNAQQTPVKWGWRHHSRAKLTILSSMEPSQHTQERVPHGEREIK